MRRAAVTTTETTSVWTALGDACNPAYYRPQRRAEVIWRELTTAHGEDYVIVQNPDLATYRRIAPDELFLLELMDGEHSVQDLVIAYMMRYHKFALPRVVSLVRDLKGGWMLVDPPRYFYGPLGAKTRPRRVTAFAEGVVATLWNREFPVNGIDGVLSRAYAGGVWLLFTPLAKIVMTLVALAGLPLLVTAVVRDPGLLVEQSLLVSVPLAYGFILLVAVIHELAHAFTVKSYGRVVRRGGISVFYGSPGLFVDTQDIWMEPRGPRIASSWAGPFSGFVLAGLAGLALAVAPAGAAPFLVLFGLAAFVVNLFQLMPLIQLDGYYVLMDWLETPNLRPRALAFVRQELAGKLRRRERFDRQDRIFAIFGALAVAYTTYIVVLAAGIGWFRAEFVISEAVAAPSFWRILAAVGVVALSVPIAIVLVQRLARLLRRLRERASCWGRMVGERRYRERVVALAGVPVLAELGPAPVQELARRMTVREHRPGAVLVRSGQERVPFTVLIEGIADAAGRAVMGPGDYFPLPGTAGPGDGGHPVTVRAVTAVRLLVLVDPEARTRLAEHLARHAESSTRAPERAELEAVGLLDGLSPQQKDTLLAHLRPRECTDGETIVEQGDPGTEFVIIRTGRVALTDDEQPTGELGPGDFFGETALLLDAPHPATARAVGVTRLWTLDKPAFDDLLCRYFDLSEQLVDTGAQRLAAEKLRGTVTGQWLDVAVGEPAPDFELDAVSGPSPVALSHFRGGPVLLWFSRGFNCPYCREYMVRLTEAMPQFEAAGVQVVQVAPNLIDAARRFWADTELPFPFLCDPEKVAYRLCGLADIGFGECQRNVVSGFARSFATGEGRTTLRAAWLDVVNPSIGERLTHHTTIAMQQGVFLIDSDGNVAAKYVFGPLDEPPSNAELISLVTEDPPTKAAG